MNLRKKRCVLMNSGVWKGHIRSISGNPVILDNALGLRTLEVLGNSVQDGTPSPDNPVEVVGVGESTNNLFNAALHPKIVRGGYLTDTAALVGTPLKIPVDAGKTYTIYRKNASATNRDFYFRAIRFEDNNGLIIRVDTKAEPNNTIFYGTYDVNYFAAAKFTVPDGAAILRVGCLPNTADALQKLCDEIMLVEGEYTADTLPPYEPYGYKVAVTASGLNLFKQTGNAYSAGGLNIVAEYQEYIINGTTRAMFILSLEKNINLNIAAGEPITFVTEILDGEIIYPENSIIYFVLFNSDNTAYIGNKNILKPQKSKIIATGNLPSTNNGYNFAVQCLKETGIVFNNVRIRLTVLKGTYTADTLPPYEPYKEPQTLNVYTPQILHGLGDVSDTVVLDFDNRKAELVQNIEQKVFDGGWSGYSQTGNICKAFHTTIPPRRVSPVGIIDVASDIFIATTASLLNNAVYQIAGNTNTLVVNVTLDANALESADIDGFNTFMSLHPATIYYVLRTPITTDISNLQDWDNMPDISGTIILTANSTAKPKFNVTYYSTEKE